MTVDNPPAPVPPSFSAAQYEQAVRTLLPRGRAWNREDGSNQALFCDALGKMYEQQDADSRQMLANFFPGTATDGLTEWNASVGIPDACSGVPATNGADQQQIVAKLIATGGQSLPYFEEIVAALGYAISITEFNATHQGTDAPAGMIVHPDDWAHTWRVNILNAASAPADTTTLSCLLTKYKPAHTQFYIVDGTPLPYYRLFNVTDNVSEPLLIPQA